MRHCAPRPDSASSPAMARAGVRTLVSPDVATCGTCLAELFDPADRRYRHPFINCTDCGPRFTIIRDVPYDRPDDHHVGLPDVRPVRGRVRRRARSAVPRPTDRLPRLRPDAVVRVGRRPGSTGRTPRIAAAQRALLDGLVVAVKGVGGYHLACRADSAEAVRRLRARKSRDEKPFALLARDLATARRLGEHRCRRRTGAHRPGPSDRACCAAARTRRWTTAVAPGNPLLGVLLPYTPAAPLAAGPGAPQRGSGARRPRDDQRQHQ